MSDLIFEVICRGRVFFSMDLSEEGLPYRIEQAQSIYAGDPFGMVLRRTDMQRRFRIQLGSEVIWTFEPIPSESIERRAHPPISFASSSEPTSSDDIRLSHSEQTEMQAWLRNNLGDSQILLEKEVEEGVFSPILTLPLQVAPRPSVQQDFVALLEDITQVHAGLVQDVVGRSWIKKGMLGESLTHLQPEPLIEYLEQLVERLGHSIHQIARQPSKQLTREPVLVRYRGGDLLDNMSIASLMRARETRIDGSGRVRNIGKVRIRRPILTDDLSEHRHIASELKRLSTKAKELASYCASTASLLEQEEARWGEIMGDSPSVYQQIHEPRVQAYRKLSEHALSVGERLRSLIQRYPFLSKAEQPRTPFGITPIFHGRPDYREVFRLLVDARRQFGVVLDNDSTRIHTKDFPTLYEMWCFLQVVAYLNERLGAPKPLPSLGFSKEILHPSLVPGQRFLYRVRRNLQIEVCYEQEFLPWRSAQSKQQKWGAAFTSEPLRPDITITVEMRGFEPVMLVLDAKSSDHFSFSRFRSMADYSRQIFDVQSGEQPVKQVFLLHRDRTRTSRTNMTNVPHYLKGRKTPLETVILGAVPVVPGEDEPGTDILHRVLDLFLATYAEISMP